MNNNNSVTVDGLIVEHATAEGQFVALDNLHLVIEGGSSVAIMGPSGCGKSTLLGVLAGLATPTAGSIQIGETAMTALSETAMVSFRKENIGIVYQADNLLSFLTISENIRLQLMLCNDLADAEARIATLLERLGLSELSERLPDQLSGGQRQRVAIARAIIHRPLLILADEPTGSLDEDNAAAVVQLLLDAQVQLGSTLVVVTHDPAVASRLGRLVALRNGAIEANHAR